MNSSKPSLNDPILKFALASVISLLKSKDENIRNMAKFLESKDENIRNILESKEEEIRLTNTIMNEHEANFRKTLADLQFQTYFTSEAIQTRQLLELLVAVECYLEGYLLDVTKKDSYTFHLKLMCDDSKKEGEKLKNFVVKLCKDYKFDFIQVIKTIAELFGIWSICNYLKREIVIVDDKKILTKQQMDEFFKKKGEYTERNLLE